MTKLKEFSSLPQTALNTLTHEEIKEDGNILIVNRDN